MYMSMVREMPCVTFVSVTCEFRVLLSFVGIGKLLQQQHEQNCGHFVGGWVISDKRWDFIIFLLKLQRFSFVVTFHYHCCCCVVTVGY